MKSSAYFYFVDGCYCCRCRVNFNQSIFIAPCLVRLLCEWCEFRLRVTPFREECQQVSIVKAKVHCVDYDLPSRSVNERSKPTVRQTFAWNAVCYMPHPRLHHPNRTCFSIVCVFGISLMISHQKNSNLRLCIALLCRRT